MCSRLKSWQVLLNERRVCYEHWQPVREQWWLQAGKYSSAVLQPQKAELHIRQIIKYEGELHTIFAAGEPESRMTVSKKTVFVPQLLLPTITKAIYKLKSYIL